MGNHLRLMVIMHFHKTVFGKQQMQEIKNDLVP